MRSHSIYAHSAARIRLIIREAVRARMGLLREGDGDTDLVLSWGEEGGLTAQIPAVSALTISRIVSEREGTQINSWGAIGAGTYTLLDAGGADAQSNADGILVRATPSGQNADQLTKTIMFSTRPKRAGASAVTSDSTSNASAGSSAASASDASAAPAEPHAVAGDVRDLARQGVRAVAKDFAAGDEENRNTIKISDLADPPTGHKWLTNDERGKLGDWQAGDEYTYIALVNNDNDPVLFVVSGDPEDNNHHSTGYILAPDSRQSLHRKAFCILYKRATGNTHPSCMPRSGGGGGAGRGGGRGGASQGAGSGDSGATGSGSGGEGSRYVGTAPDIDTGGRSVRVRADGDRIRSGGGDAESVAGLNRNRERIFGRRFYSRSDEGFDRMGPGGTATPTILRMDKREDGLVPKTIVVVFRNPLRIDPNAIAVSKDGEQRVSLANSSLGNNRDASDIASIGFYYRRAADSWRALSSMGIPRSPGSRFGGKFTQKDDPAAFQAAADWIFANPQQFDLAEDIEFHGAKESRKKADKGVSDTAQKAGGGGELGTGGASADAVAEFQAKQKKEESLNESRRTPLLDRYRF